MNGKILKEIIGRLYCSGYPVVAIVCDMGPTNCKLWREMDVTPEKPWFSNPTNLKEKVFVFMDAPHLQLIRNHFLDTGLIYEENLLSTRPIWELIRHTSKSDMSITYKLSEDHLTVKGPGRQKVKLAAQLFSNTTAKALTWCHSRGMDICQAPKTAEFVGLVNDWFDVLNSKMNTFNYPGKEPFGRKYKEQTDILNRMTDFMSKNIVPGKKTTQHFQKGIITTNNALDMLHKYVAKYFKN